MKDVFLRRRDKLRKHVDQKGLQGLVVTHAANRYYLSGFELHDPQCNESAGTLIITPDGNDWLLTDPRYEEAAARVWPRERVFIYRGKRGEKIRDFLKGRFQKLGFDPETVSVALHRQLREAVELTPAGGLVEELREVKDQEEIERLRKSCALNHALMQEAEQSLLRPGSTEEEAAWGIEKYFREHGASGLAFSSIVAVGPNGALPHAIPGDKRIEENSPVLVDVGCRLEDYCSDQTRTFWVGSEPAPEFAETLKLVQEAQRRVIEAIRPDMGLKELYHVAMGYFQDNGVGEHFTHGLGHGVGLETHERPGIGPHSEGTLKPGMVITVEPGLYYPSWGGVRWEYMVLVTEGGAEIL